MKVLPLLASFFLFFGLPNVQAQPVFETRFHKGTHDYPIQWLPTKDGGCIVSCRQGNSQTSQAQFSYIVKVNARGDSTWSRDYTWRPVALLEHADNGNILVFGYDTRQSKSFVEELAPDGRLVHAQNNDMEQYKLRRIPSGGYAALSFEQGEMAAYNPGLRETQRWQAPSSSYVLASDGSMLFLNAEPGHFQPRGYQFVKTGVQGTREWMVEHPNKRAVYGKEDQDGHFILYYRLTGNDRNHMGGLMKLDSRNGQTLWDVALPEPVDYSKFALDEDGVIFPKFRIIHPKDTHKRGLPLVKFNFSGELVWEKTFGDTAFLYTVRDLEWSSDGYLLLDGIAYQPHVYREVYVLKTDIHKTGEPTEKAVLPQEITASPNPASSHTHFQFPSPQLDFEEIRMECFDAAGRLAFQSMLAPTGRQVDLSELPNGAYVFRFSTLNGQHIGEKKLIVKH
jgi:hypothetical protein